MTTALPLPPQFSDFAPHIGWALPTSQARVDKRRASTPEELTAFYNLALARADEALTLLDEHRLDALPADLLPLFHLTLSLAEIAPYVEWFKGKTVSPTAADFEHRLCITTEPR